MNIHTRIAEMTGLAEIYAEDGAFRSAANTLRKLADELDAHAAATDLPLQTAPGDYDPAKLRAYQREALKLPKGRMTYDLPLKAGKVMEAPSGAFVPPLAHLTDEQQHAVRKADAERIKRGKD